MSTLNPHIYKADTQSILDDRKWLERVEGRIVRKRKWRGRMKHPFPEADDLTLKPINASQTKGFKPLKKKRGRKLR